MDTLVNVVAVLSLPGLILTGALGGGLGVAMGALLIAGLIDGPRGGRLASRVQRHPDPVESDAPRPRPPA